MEDISRAELQALAKQHDIKANMKSADLISLLRDKVAFQERTHAIDKDIQEIIKDHFALGGPSPSVLTKKMIQMDLLGKYGHSKETLTERKDWLKRTMLDRYVQAVGGQGELSALRTPRWVPPLHDDGSGSGKIQFGVDVFKKYTATEQHTLDNLVMACFKRCKDQGLACRLSGRKFIHEKVFQGAKSSLLTVPQRALLEGRSFSSLCKNIEKNADRYRGMGAQLPSKRHQGGQGRASNAPQRTGNLYHHDDLDWDIMDSDSHVCGKISNKAHLDQSNHADHEQGHDLLTDSLSAPLSVAVPHGQPLASAVIPPQQRHEPSSPGQVQQGHDSVQNSEQGSLNLYEAKSKRPGRSCAGQGLTQWWITKAQGNVGKSG